MKAASSSLLSLVATLSTVAAAPAAIKARQHDPKSLDVTKFTASKEHLSSICDYSFNLFIRPNPKADSILELFCKDTGDSGFSGSTYLGNVYNGTCYTDQDTTTVYDGVTFQFTDSTKPHGTALLEVNYDDKDYSHRIPAKDIKSTSPENPFETDTYYAGPQGFEVKRHGATAAPASVTTGQANGEIEVSKFRAAKEHLSAYCDYSFTLDLEPKAYCRDQGQALSSSSTTLGSVYNGTCYSDADTTKVRDDVTFTFYGEYNGDGEAELLIEYGDEEYKHVIPADEIESTSPENPYETDVYYTGPEEFDVVIDSA